MHKRHAPQSAPDLSSVLSYPVSLCDTIQCPCVTSPVSLCDQSSVLVWHSPVSLCDTILFPIHYSTGFLKATTLAKGPPVACQSCVHVGMHTQAGILPLACLILIGFKFVCVIYDKQTRQGGPPH